MITEPDKIPLTEPLQAGEVFRSIRSGLFGRCPHCGRGRLFRAFLKVADRCPACSEELHHHQADDFPSYLVILIVGHIVVPLVLVVETEFAPPYWFSMTAWPLLTLVLGLVLLQPVKGAVVGLQWAMGMHGFEESRRARSAGNLIPANTR